MAIFVIISGCSGGGKSTLVDALRQSGEAVIEEPGRRVIAAERASGGDAVPWLDRIGFVRRIVALSRADLDRAAGLAGRVFLDRGLVDAAVALEHATGEPADITIADARFHRSVFLAPPWPEIHVIDDDRRHGLGEAIAEYDRLEAAYLRLGHDVHLLPKTDVASRLRFVLNTLEGQ